MQTTIIIDTDKLGLWRTLTWLKNMGITVASVQVGEQPKEEAFSEKRVAEVMQDYAIEEQKLVEEASIKPAR